MESPLPIRGLGASPAYHPYHPPGRIEAPSPFHPIKPLAVAAGFEPATPRFEVSCSIQLSYGTNAN